MLIYRFYFDMLLYFLLFILRLDVNSFMMNNQTINEDQYYLRMKSFILNDERLSLNQAK